MRGIAVLIAQLAFLLGVSSAAWAQMPERYGFYGHVDGRWMWLGGDQITEKAATAPSTRGPGGQMKLGFKMQGDWDVALAGDIQTLLGHLIGFKDGTLKLDTYAKHFDLEMGYSTDWWRASFGLRGIHYNQVAAYNTSAFAGYDQREMYGIGPKVGIGVGWSLSETWVVVGGANAALLFTSYSDYGSGVLVNGGAYWGVAPQLDGELGLNWRSSEYSAFSFTLGARLVTTFNAAITPDPSHRGTLIEFGPFVRAAYNFGVVRRPRPVPAPADEAPPARSANAVYFDFEGTELSPVAAAAVRQAAQDAQRGRPVNLEIAALGEGRAPPDSALALRRATIIREELIRHGLAAEQVQVSHRSACDLLKPEVGEGADARNRRVQITF